MVEQVHPNPPVNDNTTHESDVAPDISILKTAWQKVARAEGQLQLLRELGKAKVGLAESEEFIKNLEEAKISNR